MGCTEINCIEIRTEAYWRLQFSGHLLMRPPSPTSWPRTGFTSKPSTQMFMAQKVSQPDIDVFFDEPRPIPSISGIFTYIYWPMDGMGDEHLKLQHPKSDLPSNRLKFCNLKIAPGATAIAWDREPHQQIHHS